MFNEFLGRTYYIGYNMPVNFVGRTFCNGHIQHVDVLRSSVCLAVEYNVPDTLGNTSRFVYAWLDGGGGVV